MHAQTLLVAILAAGFTVRALPTSAPNTLSTSPGEAPVGIPVAEPAILVREPGPEPEPHKKNKAGAATKQTTAAGNNVSQSSNQDTRFWLPYQLNTDIVHIQGTAAAGGQQAKANSQGGVALNVAVVKY